MIGIVLWDLRWRMLIVLLISVALYFLEIGFHQHDEFTLEAVALGPVGISATLAYLAGLSMIVLLGGFISEDRRNGYTRLFFSHPTTPLGYYGLRWVIAYGLSFGAALAFLVVGQVIAWGRVYGGWSGLLLPLLSALIYGGLVAFFSATLARGDAWIVFLLFLPTFFPQLLSLGLQGARPAVRQTVLALLPPHGALQDVWDGLLYGTVAWWGVAVAAGYGLLFLTAAALLIVLREWP